MSQLFGTRELLKQPTDNPDPRSITAWALDREDGSSLGLVSAGHMPMAHRSESCHITCSWSSLASFLHLASSWWIPGFPVRKISVKGSEALPSFEGPQLITPAEPLDLHYAVANLPRYVPNSASPVRSSPLKLRLFFLLSHFHPFCARRKHHLLAHHLGPYPSSFLSWIPNHGAS